MVYVMLGTGFEEMEAITPVDLMRRAGIEVYTVGIHGPIVRGSHNIAVEADLTLEQMEPDRAEMILLPGGLGGVASIRGNEQTLQGVRRVYDNGGYVAAICAGPTVLADLGITNGKEAVCYPGQEEHMASAKIQNRAAHRDGRVITGASAGCAVEFALEAIAALRGRDVADHIREQIVIR